VAVIALLMHGRAHTGREPTAGGLSLETNVAMAEMRRRKSFIVVVQILADELINLIFGVGSAWALLV